MQQLVLESRDISRVEEVLIRYLPGLNPGLLPLSATRGLLAGPTLLALTREYGASGVEGIFHAAGVTGRQPVSDEAALELARQRDIASLPPRAPQPADTRLWHLDEVQVRGGSIRAGRANIDAGAIESSHLGSWAQDVSVPTLCPSCAHAFDRSLSKAAPATIGFCASVPTACKNLWVETWHGNVASRASSGRSERQVA